MISRLRVMRSARQRPAGALAPGLNTGPTRGKMPEGWTSSQGVSIRQMLPVQFGQPRFEIIAHQRDGQVGGALTTRTPSAFKAAPSSVGALHVDRLDAHTTFLEISLRGLRQQAEARPVGVRAFADERAAGTTKRRSASRFRASWILSEGKFCSSSRTSSAKLLPAADRGRERTIERAVKKELPVLGIEAHDIGRQHVDGEIRRELRNVFAVTLRRAVPAIACHEAGTRASRLTATSLDRHCKARILHWRRHRRPARAPERNPTRSLGRTWSSPVMTPCVCQRNRKRARV